jgi:hypothetical protein
VIDRLHLLVKSIDETIMNAETVVMMKNRETDDPDAMMTMTGSTVEIDTTMTAAPEKTPTSTTDVQINEMVVKTSDKDERVQVVVRMTESENLKDLKRSLKEIEIVNEIQEEKVGGGKEIIIPLVVAVRIVGVVGIETTTIMTGEDDQAGVHLLPAEEETMSETVIDAKGGMVSHAHCIFWPFKSSL